MITIWLSDGGHDPVHLRKDMTLELLHLPLQLLAVDHNLLLDVCELLEADQAGVDTLDALAHDEGRPPGP